MADQNPNPYLAEEKAKDIGLSETNWLYKLNKGQIVKWSLANSINYNDLILANNETPSQAFDFSMGESEAFKAFHESSVEFRNIEQLLKTIAQIADIKFEYTSDPSQADIQFGYAKLLKAHYRGQRQLAL
ncbi:MAG: hypothetical protein H6R18_2854 [Proteobacteria bacterium]|nr:hypothetical protein [Pseudomonadota bacterium]